MCKKHKKSKNEDRDFINQQIEVCKWLEMDGIDAIEISGNNFKKLNQPTPYFLENALKIRNMMCKSGHIIFLCNQYRLFPKFMIIYL